MKTASHVGMFFLLILNLDKIQKNTVMEMEIIAFVTGNILLLLFFFFYYNMVGLHLSAEARWFHCGWSLGRGISYFVRYQR